MFHRITTKPWSKINEAWNFNNQLDSSVQDAYRDPLVGGTSNIHQVDKSIYCDFYRNFAIDIVTETVYNYPYTQITEKKIIQLIFFRVFSIFLNFTISQIIYK